MTNSSSEAQQTESFGVIITLDRQESPLEHGTTETWWKSNLKQICVLSLLRKVAVVSDGVIVMSSFQILFPPSSVTWSVTWSVAVGGCQSPWLRGAADVAGGAGAPPCRGAPPVG